MPQGTSWVLLGCLLGASWVPPGWLLGVSCKPVQTYRGVSWHMGQFHIKSKGWSRSFASLRKKMWGRNKNCKFHKNLTPSLSLSLPFSLSISSLLHVPPQARVYPMFSGFQVYSIPSFTLPKTLEQSTII